jgi:hypothetical protein
MLEHHGAEQKPIEDLDEIEHCRLRGLGRDIAAGERPRDDRDGVDDAIREQRRRRRVRTQHRGERLIHGISVSKARPHL